ncbi:MAG: translation initiation factor IF-2 subunit beta [Candidatus Nitrosothermus koennekii]|nr:MAG: translation initiation factor IF-2 subunit beta [Candidatus Nitrosothermus koennekii]
MPLEYEELLNRLEGKIKRQASESTRFELPVPDVIWVGNKTILRNFAEFAKVLHREQDKILLFLAKELGSPGQIADNRAIFVGKWDQSVFKNLFDVYVKDYVLCPVCNSPDTSITKEKRLTFLVCDACGAKSPVKKTYV